MPFYFGNITVFNQCDFHGNGGIRVSSAGERKGIGNQHHRSLYRTVPFTGFRWSAELQSWMEISGAFRRSVPVCNTGSALIDNPLDLKGSLFYGVGMVLFMYGFTILNEPLGVILTVLGIVTLIIFGLIELKQKYPVFDIRFFKNRKFLSSNFASLSAYLATFAVTTILNYHLQYIKGLDSQTAGIILLVAPLCQVVLAPIAGRLSDRYVPQILAALGMGLGTVSLFLFSFLNETTPFEFLVISMIIYGVGFGLFSPPNTNVIMGSVPPKDTSVASASVATMRTVGQAMSIGILTLVFAFVMGNVPIIEKYYPLLISSCQITCLICVVLCIASVFASFVGIKSDSVES